MVRRIVGRPDTPDFDAALQAVLNGSFDAMAVISVDCATLETSFTQQNAAMVELRETVPIAGLLEDVLRKHDVAGQIDQGISRVKVDCTENTDNLSFLFTPMELNAPAPPLDGNKVRLMVCVRDNSERTATFNALQESRRQLSLHVEQTPMAIIEWDVEFRVKSWNPAAERIFGFSRREVLGRKAADLILPPEAKQYVDAQWSALIARQGGERATNPNVRKDGRTIICEWYNTPLVDFDGRVIGVASMAQDVTQRIDAEREQQRNDAEMRAVMEGARCLVWHATVSRLDCGFNWEMNVTHVGGNTSWLPISVPEDWTFQQAWGASIHPEDRNIMDARSENALLSGTPTYTQEFRCVLADGSFQWLREVVQISPIDHDHWKLVGVCTDITERKTAETALSSERNQLRTLIDNLPSIIYFKDALGRFVIGNATHARFLGAKSTKDVIGRTVYDFINRDEAEKYELDDLAILESGIPIINKSLYAHDADGSGRWYSVSKLPLCNELGTIIGLIGISHDITNQKLLEEARRKMLEEAIERADRDPLTGLLNHRHFHTRLAEIASDCVVLGERYSVVILDIDNFRFFNAAYGHPAGDEVLRNVANVIRSACRAGDPLARLGSDEFALILRDSGPDEVLRFMARLEKAVEGAGYRPEDYEWEVPVTVSSGFATFPIDADDRLDLMAVADERLKTAKYGESDSAHIVAQLRAGLSHAFENFSLLNALVSAVDNKDRYTRRHSEDVLRYSVQIATELGLDEQTMFDVKVAALLHDVGKIGVPDEVLRKPGKLTDEEFAAIKQHPVMGAIMVHAVPGLEATLDAVRYHHERWDGKGYPDGLAGKDIPLLGRLMAVADAYSAMTTDRPYRKAMDTDRADQILLSGAGTQWDPDCVHAFLRSRHNSDFRNPDNLEPQ